MNPQPPHGELHSGALLVGEWRVDPALDEISRGEETIKLEPRMMRLLCRLAESPGQVVSTPELLDSVWAGVVVGPASVYQAISGLRKILGDTGETPTYLATVARKGYRVVASVQREAAASAVEKPPAARTGAVPIASRRLRWGIGIAAAIALCSTVLINALRPAAEPQETSASTGPIATPIVELPSIVVLPLRSGSADELDQIFAASLTDLVHNRLASQKTLIAVSGYSAGRLAERGVDLRTIGKRLHVNYVLRGSAERVADNLHARVSLFNTATGIELWSQDFSRPESEIATLREAIISRIALSLEVAIEPANHAAMDLPAYELYMRGVAEYFKFTKEGYVAARDIFLRETAIYPEFPRGYFGLSIALDQFIYYPELSSVDGGKSNVSQSINALDKAIALDPEFGEAIIHRASHMENTAEAERLFRRGLMLVPSYDIGFYKYSQFLFDQGRIGEGLSAVERGLRVDPLSPMLLQAKADALVDFRGDVAGSEAVLRALIGNRPDDTGAQHSLAFLRYTKRGETAESIGMFERLIAHDPTWPAPRYRGAIAYLDVDDPEAAAELAKEAPFVNLEIAQYRRTPHAWNSLPPDDRMGEWRYWSWLSVNPVGEALRDEAIATGNYSAALAEFEKIRTMPGLEPVQNCNSDLSYAHTLVLAGALERGRALARSVLRTVETEQIGRPANWFARTRAAAYVLLGDDDGALAELTASQKQNDFVRWWYTAELDPLYAHLRSDPGFQALANAAKQHRKLQRELVDDMKRKGIIPQRP